jgi:2-iminobutanoate/2-iminopropanoate deaminase
MEKINTKNVAAAIGPYSHAVKSGNLLFLSGQIPVNINGELIQNSITEATEQIFDNIEAILAEEKLTIDNVVKTTVFLKNIANFAEMNKTYEKRMNGNKPARSTIEVSNLPKNAIIEIECVAENP